MGRTRGAGAALALVLTFAATAGAGPGTQAPHVVFILADDLGYVDLPAYRRTLDLPVDFATPNLDRLASEGMLFLDAHQSASVCAPARFATITGSHHLRARASWGIRAPSPFDHGGPHRHRTVGELMQAAGYRTAFVGKEHLGGRGFDTMGALTSDTAALDFGRTVEVRVTRGDGRQVTRTLSRPHGLVAHGFDYTYTLSDGIGAPPYLFWENDRFRPIEPGRPADGSSIRHFAPGEPTDHGNGPGVVPIAGPGDVDWDPTRVGRQLAGAAVAFIESHLRENPGVPFLLYFAPTAIHSHSWPPIDFDGDAAVLDEPVRGTTPLRKTDSVVELDFQVGRILDLLASRGIAGNTLVILTSDNGGARPTVQEVRAGYSSIGSLRGGKESPFEGGHRVPLIARWGDGHRSRIPAGVASRQLVAVTDWVASLYDLTGHTMEPDQVYDGASLLPLLFSSDPDDLPPIRRYHLVAARGIGVRYDEPGGKDAPGRRWYYFEGSQKAFGGRRFLFDLSADPGQKRDLLEGLGHSDPRDAGLLKGVLRMRHRALTPLTVHLGNWLRARRDASGLPSTPRVDYARPELRTPIAAIP